MLRLAAALIISAVSWPASAGVQPANENHAVILTYHHVADDTPASTSVTPAQFAAHLDYMENNGYLVWPLTQVVTRLRAGQPVPDNVVSITFDDAYASVYTHAWPMLKKRSWPFTVFVYTDGVDAGRRPYMDWAQLKSLVDAGIEIGNHSQTHAHMVRHGGNEQAGAWRTRVRQDITRAQRRIRDELGVIPRLFAYPYGEYTAALGEEVGKLELIGFGQHSGAVGAGSNFNALPRFPVGGAYASLEQLATRLDARPLNVRAEPAGPLILRAGEHAPPLTLTVAEGPHDRSRMVCYASGQGEMQLTAHAAPGRFAIQPHAPLPPGRSKYNCTVPHESEPGVNFWWSFLIMKPHTNGRWYEG